MKNLIAISVSTEYLDNQSKPEDGRYVFAYHITIENHASQAVQLLSRHWIIVDANQERKEVTNIPAVWFWLPQLALWKVPINSPIMKVSHLMLR
jgi:uncharacterized protein affecting Mg2+/Co2+ transport